MRAVSLGKGGCRVFRVKGKKNPVRGRDRVVKKGDLFFGRHGRRKHALFFIYLLNFSIFDLYIVYEIDRI